MNSIFLHESHGSFFEILFEEKADCTIFYLACSCGKIYDVLIDFIWNRKFKAKIGESMERVVVVGGCGEGREKYLRHTLHLIDVELVVIDEEGKLRSSYAPHGSLEIAKCYRDHFKIESWEDAQSVK